ncbi:MAG: DotI/IcmL family type IV secretion protein [Bdellovibrionales bacterium]
MVRIFFAIVLCFICVPAAQAGWLEFFFPSLKDQGPDPAQTLVAPFAAQEQEGEAQEKLDHLPVNAVPLDKPHRLTHEVTDWVMQNTGFVLNFPSEDPNQDFAAIAPLFDDFGRGQFTAFLTDNNIMKVIQTRRYAVRSYVDDTPLLLNEGAVEGRYRWLYQVPVVISYMDRAIQSYRDGEAVNQKAMLQIQVGRSADAQNDDGLLFERWSGTIGELDRLPQ